MRWTRTGREGLAVPTDEPKAPRKTAAQRRTEKSIERLECWAAANRLLLRPGAAWAEGVTPYDVLALAQWLNADNND